MNRLSWLVASQSFLFTAYAITLAAARARAWLLGTFRTRIGDDARLDLPPIHAPASIIALGELAPRVLPLVFLAVWLCLLFTGCR